MTSASTSNARHLAAVVLLAVAGLVVAVALGVLVARSVSHSVALGGADLGAGSNLVVTDTTRTAGTTPATTPATTHAKPTTTGATTPASPSTTDDGDADNSGHGGGSGDHDSDD